MRAYEFLIAAGFLLTFGAVGGIELDGDLITGVVLALVGLATLWCGITMMKVDKSRD